MRKRGDNPEQQGSGGEGRPFKSRDDHSSRMEEIVFQQHHDELVPGEVQNDAVRRNRFRQLLITLPLKLRLDHVRLNAQDYLAQCFYQERVAGTFFHFAPLFVALGIVSYFQAGAEPSLSILLLTFAICAITAWTRQSHDLFWVILCASALFFAGMSAGKIRTDIIANKSLTHQITGKVSGTIIEVTKNRRGAPRYLIVPASIEKLDQSQLPNYVRLSAASKHQPGKPGDQISGLARLRPFSGPAYPGSFDFSFNAWFNGLGGSGFFMGKPAVTRAGSITLATQPVSLSARLFIAINQLRSQIAKRISRALPGESGDVAVALIIGERSGIDDQTQESLRASGLAHVLAISGMHMAMVSLSMIWAVRLFLSLNSKLVAHYPIKSLAATAGFAIASCYLMLSGMSIATKRAWIMISIVILAMILNRKSITLRGVALAAIIILILQPESLLSPGFQMSFAAVAAIVAAYEWVEDRKGRKGRNGSTMPNNRLVRFFTGLLFTSLIAGVATSFFAAFHFHRIAPLGLITNLLAMPLVSIMVMPFALISMFIMPYGYEELPLAVMGQGIEWVVAISNMVNEFGGKGITGILPEPALPMIFVGLFLLTMMKTPLRLAGLFLLVSSVMFLPRPQTPDVMISEDGRAIAIRDEEDKLAMLYPKRNKFVRDIWLRAFSDDKQGGVISKGRCDNDICTAKTRQGAQVYVVYDPDLLPLACRRADILLAPRLRWVNCWSEQPLLIVRRGHLEEFGAHAIYFEPTEFFSARDKSAVTKFELENIRVSTAINSSERPWNMHRKGRADYLQDEDRKRD